MSLSAIDWAPYATIGVWEWKIAPTSIWQRYGLEHPSGPRCRGYPDTIPHALDPEVTREALRQTRSKIA